MGVQPLPPLQSHLGCLQRTRPTRTRPTASFGTRVCRPRSILGRCAWSQGLPNAQWRTLQRSHREGNKYERHHLISSHALKETRPEGVKASTAHREGICVRMSPEDHAKTNNYRSFPGANAQRNHEIDMIKQGRRNELFSEQIQDVQSISHNYDEGLLQAWMADRARPD